MSNQLNIQAIYDYAKLSTFAYVDLSHYLRDSLTITDIIKEGDADNYPGNTARIPKVLGEQMFDPNKSSDVTGKWTVVDPYFKANYATTGHSDPASGFAAMLLENDEYGKVLAIAGTEPSAPEQDVQDGLDADIGEIGFWGIAFKQLVSLYNYVQVLKGTGKVDQLVVKTGITLPADLQSLCFLSTPSNEFIWLEKTTQEDGLGLISDVLYRTSFTVLAEHPLHIVSL